MSTHLTDCRLKTALSNQLADRQRRNI